jgi:hypothetical protein
MGNGGVPQNVMQAITGMTKFDFKKGDVMAALANKRLGDSSIVQCHAYAILDIVKVKEAEKTFRSMKLKNPWSHKEWTGAFSDKDSNWTPYLRQFLKLVDTDDGQFWMQVSDFRQQFESVGGVE